MCKEIQVVTGAGLNGRVSSITSHVALEKCSLTMHHRATNGSLLTMVRAIATTTRAFSFHLRSFPNMSSGMGATTTEIPIMGHTIITPGMEIGRAHV